MLTTTNQNHSNNPYPPITPEQARRQAERCGRAALRGRPNPDPAVIDVDLAGAIALEQMWRLGGESYSSGQVYVATRSALRIECERGPAGITGLTSHYDHRRRCARAVEDLRQSLNAGCPPRGLTPSLAEVIQLANSRRRSRQAVHHGDWQASYMTTMPTDLRGDVRDFTEMICDRDEAQRLLDELAARLSPLAQQALAIGLEWGELPKYRELAEIAGVSIDAAGRALREIAQIAHNFPTRAPLRG